MKAQPSPDIARVSVREAGTIAALGRVSFHETYGVLVDPDNLRHYIDTHFADERIRTELETPGFDFHLARMGGEPAGFMKLRRDGRLAGVPDGSLQVERIYVLRRFQGLGIGTALIERALRTAREAGHPVVWLRVWRQNAEAIGFYQARGFRRHETAASASGSEQTEELLLRLDIPY